MESLCPIYWSEGMFLRPQHFQQQDLFHEALVRSHQRLRHPFCWGINALKVDLASLRSFRFVIEHCELITEEGTLISYKSDALPTNARIIERRFQEEMRAQPGKDLDVYFGVKRLQSQNNAVDQAVLSDASSYAASRFSVRTDPVRDLFSGDGQEPPRLQSLMYEVCILCGDESHSAQGYEQLQIAKLQPSADGQGATLASTYFPPALSIALEAYPELVGIGREILGLLRDKGRQLVKQRGRHMAGERVREPLYVLMLQTVNRYIPLLQYYLKDLTPVHPCDLYALLLQLYGELATFSDAVVEGDGADPLAYKHRQIWNCFDHVRQDIIKHLKRLTLEPGNVHEIPLKGDDKGRPYFVAELDDWVFAEHNRYYMIIEINRTHQALENSFEKALWKIGAREAMQGQEGLLNVAIPGVKVEYVVTRPEGLPRQGHCFALVTDGSYWKGIREYKNIAMFCNDLDKPSPNQPGPITLWVNTQG